MSCTCRSFPDRLCGCHLTGVSHKECTCVCDRDAPTRSTHDVLAADWEDAIDLDILALGTCQVCGRYTADRYCYATDRCKEAGGGEVM